MSPHIAPEQVNSSAKSVSEVAAAAGLSPAQSRDEKEVR